ncbi:hypothetical protein SAMN05892877_102378 [Rhizobium subbaraonis]|uniref:STAS domain-containing protein n=1 Tax=Rhizobium subbaraonis TaxID=908946 RepID=A0A285U2X3_9HYPH|nr:STAS domain-containing protein [Rhizobium subbaraonis]SOC36179.1 hypothetical protein SAMN05892877_102378 [Rhizobium subbaraonis]
MSDPQTIQPHGTVLPPSLSIRNATTVRDLLQAAFESTDPVMLSVPDDADIDLSFLQLVEAARRHAELNGRAFGLQKPAMGNLLSTLERAGFITAMTPRDREFWLHRKEQQ